MRRNPLLAKPKRHLHSRGSVMEPETLFRRVTGRRILPQDWDGVHVTTDILIAMVYASGASERTDGGPGVIFGLDLRRHVLLPEIDGIAHLGSHLLDAREDYAELLGKGYSPYEADDVLTDGDVVDPTSAKTPAQGYMDEHTEFSGVWQHFNGAFTTAGTADQALAEFLRSGMIPNEVIVYGSSMARTLQNVPASQVLSVTLVRPWGDWGYRSEDDEEDYESDDEIQDDPEVDEVNGFARVFGVDAADGNWPFYATLHARLRKYPAGDIWWHGTSLSLAKQAMSSVFAKFPKRLVLPPFNKEAELELGGLAQSPSANVGVYETSKGR